VVPDGSEPEDRGQKTEDRSQKADNDAVLRPPSSVVRVLLADDHEIVREGLRSLLSDEGDFEVVGEAANGREVVDLAGRLKPDVVIMDISMPLLEGDEATRQIKTHLPHTRVIALSMYDEPERMETMHKAGAERYLLKTAATEELVAAIRGPNGHEN
jgi:DNA-binding NarL/FixJ family response regulator